MDKKVKEFELETKMFCAITNNNANMKKAINLWDSIKHLPCSAHTLQLIVIKALKIIKPCTKQIHNLIKFFQ